MLYAHHARVLDVTARVHPGPDDEPFAGSAGPVVLGDDRE
jgi:hypothetical protein